MAASKKLLAALEKARSYVAGAEHVYGSTATYWVLREIDDAIREAREGGEVL